MFRFFLPAILFLTFHASAEVGVARQDCTVQEGSEVRLFVREVLSRQVVSQAPAILLIHGARAVIRQVDKKKDPRSRWLQGVRERRGTNRACVAQANKTARIAWVLLAKGARYRKAA